MYFVLVSSWSQKYDTLAVVVGEKETMVQYET